MITELGLKEAPHPVRETPGWRKPQRIVVRAESPGTACPAADEAKSPIARSATAAVVQYLASNILTLLCLMPYGARNRAVSSKTW